MSFSCFSCGSAIFDTSLYACDGRHFHKACLKCQACAQQIQPELQDKLYAIDGMLVCRKDYSAMRSACRVCRSAIQAHEYRICVNNSAHSIHLDCMSCQSCRKALERGDKYVFADNRLLCQQCCHQFVHHFHPNGGATAAPSGGGRRGRKRANNTQNS